MMDEAHDIMRFAIANIKPVERNSEWKDLVYALIL